MIINPYAHFSNPVPFFASDPMLSSGWEPVTYPSAFYDAATDRTYVVWQFVGEGANKGVHVAYYDHATGTWSTRYTVGNFVLANDDHGHPAIFKDADGYLHCIFGSHGSVPGASGAKSSDSVLPNDISSWTQNPDGGEAVTYPKICVVSGSVYWMRRLDTDLSRRPLSLRVGTVSSGVISYGAAQSLVDFGPDSRVYQAEAHVIGSDIHFVCTRANASDTARKGVYYFVYKTATGAVDNYDGSVSVASGSLPVDLTTSNASFRIFDHGSNDGDLPSLQFDSNGDAHVLFPDGLTPSYALKHMKLTAGSWSAPVTIATLTDRSDFGYVDTYCLVPGASATMEAWYNQSGNKVRKVYSSGSWGAQETMVRKQLYDYVQGTAVRDADFDFRVLVSENLGSVTDSAAQPLKLHAHGDSGFLPAIDMTAQDANWASVALLYGFNSRDGSASAIDESPDSRRATFNGGAQIDTSQFRFGNASLLLDGSGDYVTLPHSASLSVISGDLTAECWIRLSAINRLQTIFGKRPSGTATEYALYVSAANVLQLLVWDASGSTVVNIVGSSAVATGSWYHVAVSRSAATWRVFLSGALEATGVESATPGSNTQLFYIGRDPFNTSRDFQGWIDEFRFTSSVARYTSAFTAPAAAFPRK